jgi:signal recognition particle subunit SRP19
MLLVYTQFSYVIGTQLYKHIASQLQQAQPTLKYTKPTRKAKPLAITAPAQSKAQSKSAKKANAQGKKASSSKVAAKPKRVFTAPMARPSIFQPTHPIPHLDDRLPLHSPVVASGIAVAAVKREVDQAKEAKASGAGKALEGPKEGKEGKIKMKKVVVRGKR